MPKNLLTLSPRPRWLVTALGALPFILIVGGTTGGETPWQEIAPDVRARIISGDRPQPDGTVMLGLQLDMPVSTRTYWRIPGETGIPTQLKLSGSDVTLAKMFWPHPTIETSTGYLDYAYFGPTLLPFSVSAPAKGGATAAVDVTMGICLEICIPVSASFSLPLNLTKADLGHAMRLDQAMTSVPIAWIDSEEPFGAVTYDASTRALRVEVKDPGVDLSSVIADVDRADILFGAPVPHTTERSISLPLLSTLGSAAFNGGPVRLSFMSTSGPYELWREVAADIVKK